MYDIAIIGGGCAGLSAAIYASRAGRNVILFECENMGGQITAAHLVENYPGIVSISGMEFADSLYEQAVKYGTEIQFEKVLKITNKEESKEILTEDTVYQVKAVIIATGSKHRKLMLPREEELTGHGVSYCAVCDGAFFKGQDVAVVGGGNTALSDAIFLAGYCKKVYIIHRRAEFRAERRLVKSAYQKENIEFLLDSNVTELIGEDELQEITVANSKDGTPRTISVAGLFVAVGQVPENAQFEDMGVVEKNGYIMADENGFTNEPGIFAAGDCRDKKIRQLTTAASDGASAALSACEFIEGM